MVNVLYFLPHSISSINLSATFINKKQKFPMGIFRTLAKFLSSMLFILLLSLSLLSISISRITNYSTLKEIVAPIIENQLNFTEEQKLALLEYLRYRCLNENEVRLEIGKNISVDCKHVKLMESKNITTFLVDKIFNSFYFEKHDCEFKECLEKRNLEYFLSFDFHQNISYISNYFLIFAIVFGLLYLILIESIENKLLSLGTIFITISIPYFLLDQATLLIPKNIREFGLTPTTIQYLKNQFSFYVHFLVFGTALLVIYFLLLLRKRCLLRKDK